MHIIKEFPPSPSDPPTLWIFFFYVANLLQVIIRLDEDDTRRQQHRMYRCTRAFCTCDIGLRGNQYFTISLHYQINEIDRHYMCNSRATRTHALVREQMVERMSIPLAAKIVISRISLFFSIHVKEERINLCVCVLDEYSVRKEIPKSTNILWKSRIIRSRYGHIYIYTHAMIYQLSLTSNTLPHITMTVWKRSLLYIIFYDIMYIMSDFHVSDGFSNLKMRALNIHSYHINNM